MISAVIRFVDITLCGLRGHELIKKRAPIEGSDLYNLHTQCLRCPYRSNGIDTGGFTLNEAVA